LVDLENIGVFVKFFGLSYVYLEFYWFSKNISGKGWGIMMQTAQVNAGKIARGLHGSTLQN